MMICPFVRGRCSGNCMFNSKGSEVVPEKKDQCALFGAVQFLNGFYRESAETDEVQAHRHFAELMNEIRKINGDDEYDEV